MQLMHVFRSGKEKILQTHSMRREQCHQGLVGSGIYPRLRAFVRSIGSFDIRVLATPEASHKGIGRVLRNFRVVLSDKSDMTSYWRRMGKIKHPGRNPCVRGDVAGLGK
jgi:hypothetical protein